MILVAWIQNINRMAYLKRTEFGKVELDYVLGIGGFDLERLFSALISLLCHRLIAPCEKKNCHYCLLYSLIWKNCHHIFSLLPPACEHFFGACYFIYLWLLDANVLHHWHWNHNASLRIITMFISGVEFSWFLFIQLSSFNWITCYFSRLEVW